MPARLPRSASRPFQQLGKLPTASLPTLRTLSTASTLQYAAPVAGGHSLASRMPSDYVSPTQPPSARPPETRKSQLIRTYTSLLRSTPLILFFQHNNLTAVEWAAIRRELRFALQETETSAGQPDITPNIQLSVLRTRMFSVALKLVSFFDAEAAAKNPLTKATGRHGPLVHDLSEAAYEAMKNVKVPEDSTYAQVSPLLVGPLAALVFPSVSPVHLAAALRILAPGPAGSITAAPTRKKRPGYYDLSCQNGLSKLLLVGGRVEQSIFDVDGVRWVGGIEGGMDGLRSQLVGLLQGAGLGLATTLEAGSKSVWMALEGRKVMMEEEEEAKKNCGQKEEGDASL